MAAKTRRNQASPTPPDSEDRSRQKRAVLARSLMRMFEFWQLSTADQLVLLGLAEGNRTALQRYASGEPIAGSRDALDRAGHLFGIQKNLELLYPRNEDIQRRWMSAPNGKFHNRRPV